MLQGCYKVVTILSHVHVRVVVTINVVVNAVNQVHVSFNTVLVYIPSNRLILSSGINQVL